MINFKKLNNSIADQVKYNNTYTIYTILKTLIRYRTN